MFKSFKWAFLLFLVPANILSAATYYVSTTGSDSNNGSQSAPWLTVSKAASTARAGDTVNVAAGTYTGGVTFSTSGSSGSPIVFVGNGNVIIVGNIQISGSYITLSGITCSPPSAGNYNAIDVGGQYNILTNCTVVNYGATAADQATAIAMSGAYNRVLNCTVRDLNDIDAFHIWGHDNSLVGCVVTNVNEVNYSLNHTDFVQTWGSSTYNVLIKNCLVINSSCQLGNTEMDISGGTWGWTFENCIFKNVANSYFSGIPNTHFYNCVFDNVGVNQGSPIIWYAMTTTGSQRSSTGSSVENTVFYNCSPMSGNGVSVSSISQLANYSGSSPGFVNEAQADFHLSAGSPLIGAGENLYSIFTTDMDGKLRPSSGAWDIGAYQYSSGSVSNPPSIFTISASAGTGGSISPSGSVSVNSGNSQTFTISPSSGYQISSVTVDGSNIGTVSTYTFANVLTNHTISAAFSTPGVVSPSAPTNLSANPVSPSEIELSWTAASAGTYAVAGYHIYVNGATTPTASVTTTSYHSTSLTANTAYSYAIAAYDTAGNEGQRSSISATTWPSLSTKFASSQQVAIITGPANIRQQPTNELAGAVIGTQPANAVATVIGGPIYAAINGVYYYWWNLSFSSAPSGWVAEDNLQAYSAVVNPAIQVSPGSIGFGTILSGASVTGSFTVKNAGGGTLSGSASVGAPFSIVSGGSYNLGSNQSQTVTVSFNPTSAGSFTQNVTLTGGGGATVGLTGSATNSGSVTTNIIQGPIIAATSGSLNGLLTASTTINGVPTSYLYQPLPSLGSTSGGTATYNVTITNAGDYEIQALVYAPNTSANSFLVNIDGKPQNPTMIWDIMPITSGFEQRIVSWRGSTGSENNDAIVPQIFSLSAGQHQIIFVGREPGTAMASFRLLQVVTTIQSASPPSAPSGLRIISSAP